MVSAIQRADPELLPALFSNLLRHGIFPPAWKLSKCVPIRKPGRTDTSDPNDLQPISLLSCLGKTFKKSLARRQTTAVKTTGGISKDHMGFLGNQSAIDALLMDLTQKQTHVHQKNLDKHPAPNRPS